MSEKDRHTDPEPLETVRNGRRWKRYLCRFSSPDGRFEFAIYAMNRDHAEMLIEDLKRTATVDGEMFGSDDADDADEDST